MESFFRLLIPALLIYGFARLCLAPLRLGWKIAANTLCGFASLWLLNLISGFTGILFPINAVTALIAGFLGLPGIAMIAGLQLLL